MSKLFEGKVAQILSQDFVIINVGLAAGVTVGLAFAVLAQGEDVKDPETGEVLGRWEVPKGCIRATHVQERISTCQGFSPEAKSGEEEDPSTRVLSAAMIAASMRPHTWRGSGVRLNVNRSQVAGMPSIGPISVGDVVRELPGEPAAKAEPETKQPEAKSESEPSKPEQAASQKPDEQKKAQ